MNQTVVAGAHMFTVHTKQQHDHDSSLHPIWEFHVTRPQVELLSTYDHWDSALSTFQPRKKPSYFPSYWLFDRDPYNGLLYTGRWSKSPHNWVV